MTTRRQIAQHEKMKHDKNNTTRTGKRNRKQNMEQNTETKKHKHERKEDN